MSSLTNMKTVFFKELRDVTRDRRTLYSMILVPILLYPMLSVGMGALVGSQIKKAQVTKQHITIIGEAHSPAAAEAIRKSGKFEVVPTTDVKDMLLKLAAVDTTITEATIEEIFSRDYDDITDSATNPVLTRAIDEKIVRAFIHLPERFDQRMAEADSVVIQIIHDASSTQSETAADKLSDWAKDYRQSLVESTLVDLGMERHFAKPFWILEDNVAPKARIGGMILGMMLPYMLIILVVVGGMSPALDLTAGEKERNTLETLLASPVSRFDIAAGKFLTTFTAAMVSMLLALTSMTLTARYGFGSMTDGEIEIGLSLTSLFWLLVMMVPAATLFSALMITVAIGAKSYKEGQSYLTPILMLTILPAMVTFIPGIELSTGLLFVPVVNICLGLKEVLMGTFKVWKILTVFGVTSLYALIALYLAQKIFERESVVFKT